MFNSRRLSNSSSEEEVTRAVLLDDGTESMTSMKVVMLPEGCVREEVEGTGCQ